MEQWGPDQRRAVLLVNPDGHPVHEHAGGKLGTTSRRAISASVAALCLVAAAFAIPAVAKGGKGEGHGKGKGKKATILSWDETTRTLVLTNKKGYEQTFTVAADALLTKVVPCEDDTDDEDVTDGDTEVKTCGNMDATTADLVTGYRVLNFKSEDGVIYKLKVKVPHPEPEPEPENCDDPATTDVVEECPVNDATPVPVETPVEEAPPVV